MDDLDAAVEQVLFGSGLTVDDYYIEQSPVSELLCYRTSSGRDFDLLIDHPELYSGAFARLRLLDVRVVKIG